MTLSRRALLGLLAAAPLAARAAGSPRAPTRSILTAPDGRKIAVWRWAGHGRHAGTIAFSHGAGSAPWKYPGVLDRWAAAGYNVFAPLHVDSTDHPHRADYPGLSAWAARIADMRAVSQHVGCNYIAAGHSFGALGALVLGGASAVVPTGTSGPLRDPHATCVVAFSPPPPVASLIDTAGYATLATSALIQTGTRDIPAGKQGDEAWRSHLAAYDTAAPGGHRYAAVLDGVDHYFGGAICDFSQRGPPQTAELAQVVVLSLLFLQNNTGDFTELNQRISSSGPVRLISK